MRYAAILAVGLVCTVICAATTLGGPPDGAQNHHVLHLRAGRIDTGFEADVPAAWEALSASPGARYAVQLDGPMTPGRRAALEGGGIELGDYLPMYAYVVELSADQIAALGEMPFVHWVGRYRDEWRLAPVLARRAGAAQTPGAAQGARVVVALFAGEQPGAVAARLANIGARVGNISTYAHRSYVDAIVPVSRLAALGRWQAVQFVEPAPRGRLRNDTNEWIAQSNTADYTPMWDQGLDGEGEICGLIDGPIDMDHCSFDDGGAAPGPTHRKVVAYRGTLGSDLHGTHVAGTLAGDWGTHGAPDFRDGLAYAARISFSDFDQLNLHPSTFYARLQDAHNDGARVHSNSWGQSATGYTVWSEHADRFSRNYEEALVVFATDNGGATKAPENAKNVLAVTKTKDTPNQHQLVAGSVVGPTWDGRRKPEICAPGKSTNSSDATSDCGWRTMSGTSMACPVVAAGGVLARQYFTDGFYPSGTPTPADALVPSGALLRACLINSAEDLTGQYGYPSDREGWGRLLLDDVLYFAGEARSLFVADLPNVDGLSTGDEDIYVVEVLDPAEPLRITLAWTDLPATVGTAYAPVNDLDLTVIAPDGSTYLGNVFDVDAGESQTGGSADAVNNVEQVHRLTPMVGRYVVAVQATAVNQDVQGYALALTGSLGVCGRSLLIESAESCIVHGSAGEFCADLGSATRDPVDNIEPRRAGVGKVELGFSDDIDPATVPGAVVEVDCLEAGVYSGEATVSLGEVHAGGGALHAAQPGQELRTASTEVTGGLERSGSLVVIEFDPALPDRDCCEISLFGVASPEGIPVLDTYFVRTLAGDFDLDAQVTTTDASMLKLYFGRTADESNFLFDFNGNGMIETNDFSRVKLHLGNLAPQCP